jgi:predicted Zn finger-like uncharacterized protein|tara:strand:- start:171 stop:608 length:438 start_codon:yes stop_codon:yes gene_type:complete
MIIACPSCKKKFEVEASLIPDEGKLLQCGSCKNKWFFKKIAKKDFKKFEDKTIKTESKKVPEITEKIINEAEKAIFKKGKKQIKRKKINILSFLIVIIITFVALVILADTFKNSLTLIIPGFDLVLNSLYETTKDIMLFIKDLIK